MSNKQEAKKLFVGRFGEFIQNFTSKISTSKGDWIIKGFIDVYKNVYSISIDTKVVSKVLEILLLPEFFRFAEEYKYQIILTTHQNHYPDITFIDENDYKFAVDLKSTYRINSNQVNGMTLGAFTGYFRNQGSNKNVTFPYNQYIGHYVFGVIYTRCEENTAKMQTYKLADLNKIASVIKDFTFFIQEKYRIATEYPGSGNTKNIGSVTEMTHLLEGKGPFVELGEDVFNDYWAFYLTKEMAKNVDLDNPPYKNIKEYLAYKKIK